MHRTSRFALLLLGALLLPQAAFADCDKAEKLRLEEEMNKLAARNAWSGVERAYERIEKLKCDLPFSTYFLGAESARFLGKMWQMYKRLSLAKQVAEGEDKEKIDLQAIEGAYGGVSIKGSERRPPVLERPAMPFAPDQRKAIEWAKTVIANTGKFEGLLPAGDYTVGGQPFTVEVGQGGTPFVVDNFVFIPVGKVKGGPKGDGGGGAVGDAPGLIIYSGPVATIGPNFLSTAQPSEPVLFQDSNIHQFEPANVFGGGVAVNAGYELGFTKEIGVATTVGYGGVFGNDTFHSVNGWLAGAIRPGDLRIAIGPTYTWMTAKGTGVADWFDVGQDSDQYKLSNIRWQGWAWGGGAQMTIGYGLLDFKPLQGVVELGGAWHNDGARNYLGFGLRVGIVPLIERFKQNE